MQIDWDEMLADFSSGFRKGYESTIPPENVPTAQKDITHAPAPAKPSPAALSKNAWLGLAGLALALALLWRYGMK
jgi:hypothetical protein